MNKELQDLIYGKDSTEGIVSIEVENGLQYKFFNDGTCDISKFKYWFLSSKGARESIELAGNQVYKYYNEYDDEADYQQRKKDAYQKRVDIYSIFNYAEQAMVRDGHTLFKGLKKDDVAVLAFDIEANGLVDKKGFPIVGDKAQIYIIANTFRRNGVITRRLFSLDNYSDQQEMLEDWVRWVQEINPAILVGHNVFSYDLMYLNYVWVQGHEDCLPLGRDNRPIVIPDFTRQFRKDGSQSYEYYDIKCFGRNIIDTMFLSIKYDISRKYVSYGLKQIIKQEGLEKPGRVFYDAGKIHENWHDLEERDKIKQYAEFDGDDALALYDLMIPSFFYYTQHMPMTLQHVNNTATGRQINSFLVRSYLQIGHSIAKASEAVQYEGAISFGIPGLYKNVMKIDVKSEYPSVILQHKVYDKIKDPKKHLFLMTEYFTHERFKNKDLSKKLNSKYHDDLQAAAKQVINSIYGMMGATGLNYNSPENAAFVTKKGREVIINSIKWATSKNVDYWLDKLPNREKEDES